MNEATPPDVLAALLTGDALLPPAEVCVVCVDIPPPFVHAPDCDRPDCRLPAGAKCCGAHESTTVITQQNALGNLATPAEVAVRFVGHWWMWARVELAARADLSAAGYEQLAADEIPWVRSTLAENPAIGEPLMRVLAADSGHDVQRCLLQNPNVPWDVLSALAGTVRTGTVLLPRVAAASAEQVRQLAESADPAVRALVARRRDLPAEIRDRLAADDEAKVVAAVAAHPGLPEPTLLALVARHTGQVVTQAAANPDATPAVLAAIAAHQPPPSGRAMKSVALHPSAPAGALLTCLTDPRARRFAAAHPGLPTTAIVELLDDADWEVVEAAAANPALPPEVMARLLDAATAPTPSPGS